jgi:hypothetical protein
MDFSFAREFLGGAIFNWTLRQLGSGWTSLRKEALIRSARKPLCPGRAWEDHPPI